MSGARVGVSVKVIVPSVPTSTLPYVPDVRSPGNVRVSSTTAPLIVTRAARLAWGQGSKYPA